MDELHINALPVRFNKSLSNRLCLMRLHQRKAVIAINVMPSRLLRAIHAAQEDKSLRDAGVQRFVADGVG